MTTIDFITQLFIEVDDKLTKEIGVTQLALTCKGVELDMHAPPV